MLSCLVPTLPMVFCNIAQHCSISSPAILLNIYVNTVAAPVLFNRVVLQGHSFWLCTQLFGLVYLYFGKEKQNK